MVLNTSSTIGVLVAATVALIIAPALSHQAGRSSRSLRGSTMSDGSDTTDSNADSPPRHTWSGSRVIGLPWRRSPSIVRPASLATWADELARTLRYGSTLQAALAHEVPADPVIADATALLRHWLGRGATVAQACDEWSDELAARLESPGRSRRSGERIDLLTTLAAVLAAAAELGGSAAAPLDRFAVTMRQRTSDDLERAAQSGQAKMSAKVLTGVPLAVLILLVTTDADVRASIMSPRGALVLVIGLGLNAAGALWMRQIAAGVSP